MLDRIYEYMRMNKMTEDDVMSEIGNSYRRLEVIKEQEKRIESLIIEWQVQSINSRKSGDKYRQIKKQTKKRIKKMEKEHTEKVLLLTTEVLRLKSELYDIKTGSSKVIILEDYKII